ncbi:hypothetical protein [Reyranella sp.]|uniref:hypothetical protein n=1 Tax=Reyranella sp. TaxID=1929291 RepID=UPI003BA9587C
MTETGSSPAGSTTGGRSRICSGTGAWRTSIRGRDPVVSATGLGAGEAASVAIAALADA